jgi:uncharacterized peroxidase-related enzyme
MMSIKRNGARRPAATEEQRMTWIDTISYDNSEGQLRELYDRIKGPNDNVDNIMLAHSLRPHSMQGHMTLYKYVLHHPRNTLAKAYLEAIGAYVSSLNNCDYCFEHHFAGMARLLGDAARSASIRRALEGGRPEDAFENSELAGLQYASKLTLAADRMTEDDIAVMRNAGLDDGQILEINQVTAYFGYANRMVLGLGIKTAGDIIGLSPGESGDPDNWSHS